jgi:addiction module RelE/StbE family toxin
MRIIWSPLAIQRVKEIGKQVKRDNPIVARELIDTMFKRVEKLAEFPESGAINPEAERKDIRQLVVKNHRIIYRVEENMIIVLTVRHSRQLLRSDDYRQK